MTSVSLPIALTIAGSDSGGGAGIQADLKTFQAFGVFGTCAVTAVTAQNTLGVRALHVVPPAVVRAQIDAVVEDLPPDAVKTGMLAGAAIVAAVADAVGSHELAPYVLDPVMIATSGDPLLDPGAEAAVRSRLLPLASVVTPNVPEAELLTGSRIASEADLGRAARTLVAAGAAAALVKGGHLPGAEIVDVLWDGRTESVFRHARVATDHTHGTGCTLAAAITAGLARGQPLLDAVCQAIDFVGRAIAAAPGLGRGRGPLNHFVEPASGPHPD